jgi:Icc-related predicted phosphoesterase
MVRLAAVGDLHLTAGNAGRFRPALLRLRHHADVLLLAGDLTEHGTADQAYCLAAEVRDLGIPVIAVVGNHDHLTGRAAATVAAALTDAGVHLLEETGTVLTVDGVRLGVASAMGFGGGFDPSRTDEGADRFAAALAGLDCDIRVALTHNAPTVATLAGEPRPCTRPGQVAAPRPYRRDRSRRPRPSDPSVYSPATASGAGRRPPG